MAIHIFDSSRPGPVTRDDNHDAFTMEWEDTLILAAGAKIEAYGLSSSGVVSDVNNSLLIHGNVHSELWSAIIMHGTLTVGNLGSITGAVDGVYLYGTNDPGRPHAVNNAGSINGSIYGVRLEASEGVIINSGKIVGGTGIAASASDRSLVITNTGLIEGTKDAAIYGASNGSSTIRNQGQIKGDVILGSGDDFYDGRSGTITGSITLNTGSDVVWGGNGSETFKTGSGTKIIDGGGGIDTLHYSQAAKVDLRVTTQQATSAQSWDTLLNIENLTGSNGNDSFIGHQGVNSLAGAEGNDRLDGGLGNDRLTGGAGQDIFIFSTKLKGNVDAITDFRYTEDTIHLSKAVFSKLTKGVLKKSAFFSGSTAKDASDRIGYDKATGDLFYDADGAGSKYKAVKFAQFDPLTNLKANDFWIV